MQKQQFIKPQSPSDVLPVMEDFVKRNINHYPKLALVDLQAQAIAFFNYWEDFDWKRNGKAKIKSLSRTVATWLLNAQDRVPNWKLKQYLANTQKNFSMSDLIDEKTQTKTRLEVSLNVH